MCQYLTPLLVLLLLTNSASAQLTLKVPEKTTLNKFTKIKTEGTPGNDPKFICTPENEDWGIYKSLDNNLEIIFVPGTKGTYTFTYVDNKDNKTFLAQYSIIVAGPDAPPDNPKPTPTNDFKTAVTAAYMVSPDQQGKNALITLFSGLKDQNLPDFRTCQTVLKSSAAQLLAPGQLATTRAEITKYLTQELNGPKYSNANKNKVCDNIVAVLKELP